MASTDLPRQTNLAMALEMHDFGVAMMRQNLRRKHPQACSEEIERLLVDWLQNKPELGGPCLRVTWYRNPAERSR